MIILVERPFAFDLAFDPVRPQDLSAQYPLNLGCILPNRGRVCSMLDTLGHKDAEDGNLGSGVSRSTCVPV